MCFAVVGATRALGGSRRRVRARVLEESRRRQAGLTHMALLDTPYNSTGRVDEETEK